MENNLNAITGAFRIDNDRQIATQWQGNGEEKGLCSQNCLKSFQHLFRIKQLQKKFALLADTFFST